MCRMPEGTRLLFRDGEEEDSYPVLQVSNVYMLPGVLSKGRRPAVLSMEWPDDVKGLFATMKMANNSLKTAIVAWQQSAYVRDSTLVACLPTMAEDVQRII